MGTSYLDQLLASKAEEAEVSTPAEDLLDIPLGFDSSNPTEQIDPADLLPIQLSPEETDPRLKRLSHSSRTTLHTCPRKYQLNKLASQVIKLPDREEAEQGVTFAYGHAVGAGVASTLQNKTPQQVLLDTFLSWRADLLDEHKRQNKGFFKAFFAVQKFLKMREDGFLDDYKIVIYNGKPAAELSFQILLPNGYTYRGFVDAVLQNVHTGDILVLECKTTSGQAVSANFINSGQAIGYSIVLDQLFPKLSSYTVLYLVYESKSYEYKQLPFEKSLLQRALWLQELLIDIDIIDLYETYDTYPMHGESCYDFFHDCEYLSLCTLETKNIVKPLTKKVLKDIEKEQQSYDFTVKFEDLIQTQIDKIK